jgi:exopolysaccharide production protein ExoQ
MPPILALTLGLGFIGWTYRRDAREAGPQDGILWLPTLWIMRCASRSVDFWLGGGENGRWDPVLVGALFLGALIAVVRRGFPWARVLAQNRALFAFYAYLVLSVAWVDSVEDPYIKLIRPLGDLLMALIVVAQPEPRRAVLTVFRRCAIALIPLSVVLVKYYPGLGRMSDKHWGEDSWTGVTTHKNPLSQLCILSVVAFLDQIARSRRLPRPRRFDRVALVYLALTGYLMFAGGANSRSSTSLLCLLLLGAGFYLLGRLRHRVTMVMRILAGSAAALALLAGGLALAGTSLQAVVAEAFGKDPTLTDRTYLWRDVVRIGGERPVLGSGYGGFWVPATFDQLSPEVDNMPLEAHNGYLETFANLGLVGVGLLALLILQSIRDAAAGLAEDFEYHRLRLAMLLMVVVMNYSEATFPRGMHLWWFGFLIFAVSPRAFARPAPAPDRPRTWARQPEWTESLPVNLPCRSLT